MTRHELWGEDSDSIDIHCCLPEGNLALVCEDFYGDGWNYQGQGQGYITINGNRYCDTFDSGDSFSDEVYIGPPLTESPGIHHLSLHSY